MRILFYISTIRGGGAGRVMVNLANQFCNAQDDVLFVTNFTADGEYELNPKIKRASLESTESHSGIIKKNITRISSLRKHIKKYHPNIVISFMYENDTRAFLATRGLKCKLLLSVRNDPDSIFKTNIKRYIARFVYGHADGVVFQTREARDWFGDDKKNSKIIFNQVAPEFYMIKRDKTKCHDIVTVGRFTKQKNHQMLLQAFTKIANKVEENLVIYGDGDLRDAYEKYIQENNMQSRIFLPGKVSNVSAKLAESKLFVLTSDYEGMPNALMEAMAVGLPCISTDCPCGGPKELNDSHECLDLIHMCDVDELAEKMLYLLKNDKYATSLAEKAKKRAEEFTPDKVFEQWKEFIQMIVLNS